MDTPYSYALHVSRYIADPTTVRAYVRREFGAKHDIPLDELKRIRTRALQMGGYLRKDITEPLEADDFRVGSLLPRERAPEPEPVDQTPVVVKPQAVNPFCNRLSVGERVVESVAEDFGLSHGEIVGPLRFRKIFQARSVVAKVLSARGWSSPKIGRLLGGRDHSTIIHCLRQFDVHAKMNPAVQQSYDRHVELMAEADRKEAA